MMASWLKTHRSSVWFDIIKAAALSATLILASLLLAAFPVVFSIDARWEDLSRMISRVVTAFALALLIHQILMAAYRSSLTKHASLRTYATIIRITVVLIVYGLFFLIALDTLGISITPLIASLGIGSIAVALAFQNTLANFFAGVYIILDRPIRIGDFIRLESGEEGYVSSIGWRSVWIRTLPNNTLIIPNTKLLDNVILNYYLPNTEVALLVEVGVDYRSDLKKVEQVTVEVAEETLKEVQGSVAEFDPFIRFHTFGSTSVNFTVILRVKEFVDQYLVKHEFIKKLVERYRQENISIPVYGLPLKEKT